MQVCQAISTPSTIIRSVGITRRRSILRVSSDGSNPSARSFGKSKGTSVSSLYLETPETKEEKFQKAINLLGGIYDDIVEIREDLNILNDRLHKNLVVLDHVGRNLLDSP
jgi:hypothetical protein